MGDAPHEGTPDDVHAVVGIDDLIDVDDRGPPAAPAVFPTGSEVHGLDALLAAYLIDAAAPAARTPQTLLRVLIVEPDAVVRRALREMLEVVGYDVITAPTAVSATELLARQTLHLVIADADATGAGMALRVALRATRPGLPIILMSTNPALAASWSAEDRADTRFVDKPVRGLLLLAAIRGALQPDPG